VRQLATGTILAGEPVPSASGVAVYAWVGTIVVEHRECLARFGVEYLQAALADQGRKLIVVGHAEVGDDLQRRSRGRRRSLYSPAVTDETESGTA
jgi:hypothetical protein